MNFWPIDNNLVDMVGACCPMAELSGGAEFISDRFQNTASAISLNGGYWAARSNIYFCGEFAVTLWDKLVTTQFTRVFCFTNWENNIVGYLYDAVCMDFVNGSFPRFIMQGNACSSNLTSSQSLSLNIWYHIAFTFGVNYGGILINGVVAESTNQLFQPCSNSVPLYNKQPLFFPNCLVRQNNYFGSFPPPVNNPMYAEIDFIKFYSRILWPHEIQPEMDQTFTKI